jgi:hypothetical protein
MYQWIWHICELLESWSLRPICEAIGTKMHHGRWGNWILFTKRIQLVDSFPPTQGQWDGVGKLSFKDVVYG